jgi:hypothetical protein
VPKTSEPEFLVVVIGDAGWLHVALRDIEAGMTTARLDEAHLGASVRARAVIDDRGRVGVAELRLYLDGGGVLTGEPLRALPFPQLERLLNDPAVADVIAESIERGHDGPAESAVRIPSPNKREKAPAKKDRRDAGMWEYEGDTTIVLKVPLHKSQRDLKLNTRTYDAKGKRPDEFYRRVAQVFSAAPGPGPAKRIAKANGVEASTVHRWVKEARRRGLMPKGRAQTESEGQE